MSWVDYYNKFQDNEFGVATIICTTTSGQLSCLPKSLQSGSHSESDGTNSKSLSVNLSTLSGRTVFLYSDKLYLWVVDISSVI